MPATATPFVRQYFHGTRAALGPGDHIAVGHRSNFTEAGALSWVYFAATLDTAIWGAELARGSAPGRIYIVEPTGPMEDDPNVTDKRFAGNPTMSYRSRAPLRVVAEASGWQPHSAAQVAEMTAGLARLRAAGEDIVID